MKPIKYRAWNIHENRMEMVVSIKWETDGSEEVEFIETNLSKLYPPNFILMPCIKIKDDNGLDIFVADKVYLNPIEYEVKWYDNKLGYYFECESPHFKVDKYPENTERLVIGNIYETKQP